MEIRKKKAVERNLIKGYPSVVQSLLKRSVQITLCVILYQGPIIKMLNINDRSHYEL
jgi:hypothetical protein